MTEYSIEELRKYAKQLDAYEAKVTAKAIAEKKLAVLDYKEHGVPAAAVNAIRAARSPSHKAAMAAKVTDLANKSVAASRFAALHQTKIEALKKEITDLMAAAGKHRLKREKTPKKEWDAEAGRLGNEIAKAEKSLATAQRGAEKQEIEAARLATEAAEAEVANQKERI